MDSTTTGHTPLIEKYKTLLEKDVNSKAFAPLADTYRKLGLYDKAFRVLKEGTRLNPSYFPGYLCLGQCYYDTNLFDSAYTAISPFIDTHGDNLTFLKLLARLYQKLGMPDSALATYNRLLFLNPRDTEAIEQRKTLEESKEEKFQERVIFDIDSLEVTPASGEDFDSWGPLTLETPQTEAKSLRQERLELFLRRVKERGLEHSRQSC